MTTTNISIIDFNAYIRLNKCTSVCILYVVRILEDKTFYLDQADSNIASLSVLDAVLCPSRSSKSNMAQLPLERGDKTKWVCNDQQSWLLLQRHGTRNIYIYIIYLNIQCTKANWSVLRTILIQSSVPSSISCRSSKIQKLILHG